MRPDEIFIDIAVLRGEGSYIGIGAEFSSKGQPVKVASLFYPSGEYDSTFECLRATLPLLLRHADAERVVFRSGIPQFTRPDRLTRSLKFLATQAGKQVQIKRVVKRSNARALAKDAINRKASVIVEV